MTIAAAPAQRYQVLDSWRGICACLVVMFHFDANSHLYSSNLIRHGTVYVDFFFVLSGFVIACGYSERLRKGFGVAKFMFLRAGRVWPLHVFMLALFVLFEFTFSSYVAQHSPTGREAFTGPNSLEALFANLLLLQSMNLFDYGTWNGPSWSISVEYWNYLIYAVIAVVTAATLRLPVFVAISVLLLLLFNRLEWLNLGAAHQWGILRCLFGFVAGASAYEIVRGNLWPVQQLHKMPNVAVSLVEIAVVVLSAYFIAVLKYTFWWDFTPYVFALTVLVFSAERGIISRILMWRPFLFVGTLSYSIYMVHYFIQLRMFNVGKMAEKLFDIRVFAPGIPLSDGRPLMGTTLWLGNLAMFVMLVAVLFFSWLSWRYIEIPCQNLSKILAAKIWRHRSLPAGA